MWEFVGSNGNPTGTGFTSLAHAWGAGPTQILTESVLGVTPINQGYSTFQVKPHRDNLTWAQGQVPTGSGSITVRWAADSSGQFHMQVVAPSGTSGQVWVPIASSNASTSVIAGNASFVQRSGLYDIYQVGSGTFEFGSVPSGGGGPTNTPVNPTNTPVNPTNTPTGGGTWTFCANEGGTCTFTGTRQVRYGAGSSWNTLTATNSIACNNATFGDPIQGTAKTCEYSSTTGSPTNTPVAPTNTPVGPTNTPSGGGSWVFCANENGTCTFSGTTSVRYGANGSYNTLVATNSIACNNATFGDPISGTVKTCEYLSGGASPTNTPVNPTNTPVNPTNTPTGGWTFCANEGGTCTFSGTTSVRYGAGSSWNTLVATNSIACNNATFGDPIVGTAKTCEYQQ